MCDKVITTVNEIKDYSKFLDKYEYQKNLTKKLDALEADYNQDILNEIILWKVNRYVSFSPEVITQLNNIRKKDKDFDENTIRILLTKLLETKGVNIAMASTILRFKNPNIFQIIDQRVYRLIYGVPMPVTTVISKKIDLYFMYLKELKKFCEDNNIEFSDADRILYIADIVVNKDIPIKH